MEAQTALFAFLRSRNIDERNIVKLRDDKIDLSIIESMEDDVLAGYIPIYGDRIATRRFCSEHQRKERRMCGGSLCYKNSAEKWALIKPQRSKMRNLDRRPNIKNSI
ncbi:hypothetical protein WMY93_000694 [Mugilogobius chulae]|uniref:Uncharacterized protein n=1 Tax=Mugilogobius chulae TaxID=88201 RepID=A0AAW0Q1M6_9GOBI